MSRILVFGDSIAQGFWDPRTGWVGYLAEYYNSKKISEEDDDPPSIFNLGISADTSKNVVERLSAEAKARIRGEEGVIVFSIGVNNAVVENNNFWSTPEEYRSDLGEMLRVARGFAKKIMFVGLSSCDESRTLPVAWGDYWYSNERLALFEEVLKKFCQDNNLPHVKILDLFIGREDELLFDGLHPNQKGHKLIYERVKPELEKLLALT